jgi:phosphoadenosine phosphosulfate reductase
VSTSIYTSPPQSELARIGETLQHKSAEEIIGWAAETYGDKLVLACSFGGSTGMVLLDMLIKVAPSTPVYYLDTDFLFPETYALVEQVRKRYGIEPRAVRPAVSVGLQAEREGDRLWERDADRCCAIRKVAPQREFLRDYSAWMTGIRRDQASTRAATPHISWDRQFGLAKIAPLANWTEKQVWQYIVSNDVPYNRLHDNGYPSIGCTNCTRPVAAGEDLRAGRWQGAAKIECGLHLAPVSVGASA